MTTQRFVLFEIQLFRDDGNRNLKVYKISNYQPCNWVLSEYTKSLQMWFPMYAVFLEFSLGALHASSTLSPFGTTSRQLVVLDTLKLGCSSIYLDLRLFSIFVRVVKVQKIWHVRQSVLRA